MSNRGLQKHVFNTETNTVLVGVSPDVIAKLKNDPQLAHHAAHLEIRETEAETEAKTGTDSGEGEKRKVGRPKSNAVDNDLSSGDGE